MTEEIGRIALPASKPKLGKRKRNWIVKFMLVGGSGAVLNTAVLYVLYGRLHMPLVAASAVAVELAVVNNFLLNDRWTFAARSRSIRRFAKFNVSSLGGLAVNVLSVWLLTRIGLYVLVANLVGIAAGMVVNITLSVTWVWGKRK
jgi:putative flippase GtrA